MIKILAIVGTYRKGGIIDSAVDEILSVVEENGGQTEKIYLIDKHIEFCTNCRKCTQSEGEHYGRCFHNDDMEEILQKIENADGLVLASPVNFYNVTAVMRRFIERLVCFAYWPWGKAGAPKLRSKIRSKKAVIVTATAMPAIMQQLFTGAPRILKSIAKLLGAKKIDSLIIGMIAVNERETLPEKYVQKARKAGQRLTV
ncbi:MAG: NAD(P)H dehydrogenase [Planctomycetes bacterium GWF2_41_51]|nr:MAG: NAD(P)H dehydrogenase [Planctomycetes bacterium GWF2_41_51]HBG25999.1 NAD(P)H dehydrogenase [Phycisphaerales bacterium]